VCGVVGFVQTAGESAGDLTATVSRMAATLLHRGPDHSSGWVDAKAGIALGHRRLSILDLSPQGHQPMRSASGRYVIAFNGEIYNHRALRAELDSRSAAEIGTPANVWRGHSDTEVMLAAIEHWGVKAALPRFNGMFAFALWDTEDQVLHLARDRFGEKPLYYGSINKAFLFASELKALRTHPAWRNEIDCDALALYVRHSHVPAPHTIYKHINKLLPAQLLSVSFVRGVPGPTQSFVYWSAKDVAEAGVRNPFAGSDVDAVDSLDELLRSAVALRMEADVPLGAFLSGGIDSSTIVALMQAQSARAVRTFTIGFAEADHDEAKHAEAVARHLRTDHTELYVSPAEALAVIPRLPEIYDEPFGDPSQIPTFLVAKLTRKHVTVALSGDAGDELFCGYRRYFWAHNIRRSIGWLPRIVRKSASRGLSALPAKTWDRLFETLTPLLTSNVRAKLSGDRLHKMAELLAFATPEEMYRRLLSFWDPSSLVANATEPTVPLTKHAYAADIHNFTQRMMLLDLVSYLPDDILTKLDRASMAVSLEARLPLLDFRVAEFAWTLPMTMKVRHGRGKWALRQVLYKYVPKELVDRPKMGFGLPLDAWLRGPLREWAENLLSEVSLNRTEHLNPAPIRQRWREHLSGERNWGSHLWGILMLRAWTEDQL
jgi:asparagine synthase (glutamine-hydrolysing)